MKIEFYENHKNEEKLIFVVIYSLYRGKGVFVRHRERTTWEIPGGHIEKGENALQAAERELYEETGALSFDLFPVCNYSVQRKTEKTFGKLFLAKIDLLGPLGDFEIDEIKIQNDLPANLTYKDIQPSLYERVIDFMNENRKNPSFKFLSEKEGRILTD